MPKDPKTSGFAALELLLAALVLIVLGVAGYFVFTRSQTPTQPAGWLTYKSTHSSIQFSYPKTWQLKQMSLSNQPNYYLEDVSLVGPNSFTLNFTLEKTHTRPNQTWSCTSPPEQADIAINAQYKMVLTDRGGVSLLATDAKASTPDDFACGSLINILGSDELFKFSGGYTATGAGSTQSIESLTKQPEVQTAKTILSSFKRVAH